MLQVGIRVQLRILGICVSLVFFSNSEVLSNTDTPLKRFFPRERFNPKVTPPDRILGFPLAARPSDAGKVVEIAEALSKTSPRVKLLRHGCSHEGRSLIHLIISSPENLSRLEVIRKGYDLLSDPRLLSRQKGGKKGQELFDTLPACAHLGYSIHGDELSSTDAALCVAYRLAAGQSTEVKQLLQKLVVIIDPLMNPDGRTRFLNQLAIASGYVPNLDYQSLAHRGTWPWGRGNHYFFDMNRDWIIGSQPETQARQELILKWHPQLVVDSHEMGPFETYLFNPPREPINVYIHPIIRKWWQEFCKDQAASFDRHGWSYYTREWYEFWFPGYTHSWASYQGAIGILYEQAGVDGKPIKRPDGTVLSYPESVHHHVVSTFANLKTLAENRKAILKDYFLQRLQACRGSTSGSHKTLVFVPGSNEARNRLFLRTLLRQGIEIYKALDAFSLKEVRSWQGKTFPEKLFPKGSFIVNADQPQGRLLLALLDWEQSLSKDFLKEERKNLIARGRSKIYDITGWALPVMFSVDCYWSSHDAEVPLRPFKEVKRPKGSYQRPGRYGALIDAASDDVYKFASELFKAKVVFRVAEKDFQACGRKFPRGSILIRAEENGPDLQSKLRAISKRSTLKVFPVDSALASGEGPDLGSPRFRLAKEPKIAIAGESPISTTSFGSIWYFLDAELRFPVSPVSIRDLGSLDLRKYNVLILPSSRSLESAQRALAPALEKLKVWVKNGGTLIAVGGSAAALTKPPTSLSRTRLRRDVLDQIEMYRLTYKIKKYESFPEKVQLQSKEPPEVKKERDRYLRLFSPHGTLLRTEVDQESYLTFGCSSPLPVLLRGSFVFLARPPVQCPVSFPLEGKLLLCGHLWPEAEQRLAGSAYLTREGLGNGQIILFADNPAFRAYLRAAVRLFLNAVFFGPGLGVNN